MHEAFPSMLDDETVIAFGAKVQRAPVSPSAAVALFSISMQLSVADVLSTIRTPTLVLHRRDDVTVPPEAGKAVADLISDALFVELPGEDHRGSRTAGTLLRAPPLLPQTRGAPG